MDGTYKGGGRGWGGWERAGWMGSQRQVRGTIRAHTTAVCVRQLLAAVGYYAHTSFHWFHRPCSVPSHFDKVKKSYF